MNPEKSNHQGVAIELHSIVKQFPGSAEPTLNGLNLRVQRQSIHAILGASGIGKSVTLKVILGLLEAEQGQVIVNGRELTTLSAVELRDQRRAFGMLFQNSALFDSLNVFENVAFPLREHCRQLSEAEIEGKVRELLEMVKLPKAEHKMPSELSGGMRKRVGLARALALDPEILLCDEPTTGLDPVTTEVIDDLIRDTTRQLKATALIISHDVHAALRIADFVSMLAEGRIIETGSPERFVKSTNETVQKFLRSAGVI